MSLGGSVAHVSMSKNEMKKIKHGLYFHIKPCWFINWNVSEY